MKHDVFVTMFYGKKSLVPGGSGLCRGVVPGGLCRRILGGFLGGPGCFRRFIIQFGRFLGDL